MDRRVTAVWLSMVLITASLAIVLVRAGDATNESIGAPEARPTDRDPAIAPSLNQTSFEPETTVPEDVTRSRVVTEGPISVHAGPSVVIFVVDESGEPVPDSPVAWGLATSDGLPPYRASTDSDGRIELDASELDALFEGKGGASLVVASLEAWVESTSVGHRAERSREDAEAKGIEIRIPATARIVVEVLEGDAPLWESVVVELLGAAEGTEEFVLLGRETAWFGRCEFQKIRPGLRYFAKASFAGLEERSDDDRHRLSNAGINPPLRIRFPELSRIHFNVIDPTGGLLRDATVSIARRGLEPAPPNPITLRLDGEGRGRVIWPASIAPVAESRYIEVSTTIGDRPSSASITLPDRLPRGSLDLGYLQLRPDPVAVEKPIDSRGRR